MIPTPSEMLFFGTHLQQNLSPKSFVCDLVELYLKQRFYIE